MVNIVLLRWSTYVCGVTVPLFEFNIWSETPSSYPSVQKDGTNRFERVSRARLSSSRKRRISSVEIRQRVRLVAPSAKASHNYLALRCEPRFLLPSRC